MVENLRSRYLPIDDPFAFWNERLQAPDSHLADNSRSLLSSPHLFYLSPLDSYDSSAGSSPSSSAQSSVVSLAMTARDEEDEDTRALRRLILRKISAHVDGAYDEVDRVNTWLSVVKTVLRDLSTKTTSSSMVVS